MVIRATPTFFLKDRLFNKVSITRLLDRIESIWPVFERTRCGDRILAQLQQFELKARIHWIVKCLAEFLPSSFDDSVDILLAALPEPLNPNMKDNDFGEYIWVVPSEYVAQYGCSHRHLTRSLLFLRESTKRFSAENAIRYFLMSFPDETMQAVKEFAHDSNYHVRRLASEGIRPNLPWSPRVNLSFDSIIDVLDELYDDDTRYVVRSVANSLNDISKSDPALVLKTLSRWKTEGLQREEEMTWLVRHALRTLKKDCHPQALDSLGYNVDSELTLQNFHAPDKIRVGSELKISATIKTSKQECVVLHAMLYSPSAKGKHSKKTYILRDGDISEGLEQLEKRISFRPMTTRLLHEGMHRLELCVNGRLLHRHAFQLLAD